MVVSRVRDTYRKAIRDATFEQIPSTEGNAAPELSKMFPLNPGPTKDAEKRDINIEVTKSPYKIDNDDVGQNRYGFEVKVVVPSKQKFHKTPKPDKWRITCKYGFYGENHLEMMNLTSVIQKNTKEKRIDRKITSSFCVFG